MLGLPQTLRKSRSYARFAGALGDQLLADVLDAAPCFFGGVAGLKLSRGQPHALATLVDAHIRDQLRRNPAPGPLPQQRVVGPCELDVVGLLPCERWLIPVRHETKSR